MSRTMETMNKGNIKMVENPEGTVRYEFYTRTVRVSNVDNSVHHYEPIIRHCQRLSNGSTEYAHRTSVEEGNEFFKTLLSKGWKVVTFKTKSFA